MKCFVASVVALMLANLTLLHAKDDNPAYTDAKKAGRDFEIQGEYVGDIADGNTWGVQVIARGDGKFEAIGFRGGLPGDGWDGERNDYLSGELKDGVVRMEIDVVTLEIRDGELKVLGQDGEELGIAKKVHRKSKTLGAKPPEGAIVLFDGKGTDAWVNGKIEEKNLLGATNCSTKKKFGDHTLHIEFRTPFMPMSRGQARGNSGVYVNERYEVQVLDSFGLEGKDNECGGVYSASAPKVNMCYPPLSWQTYDIDFAAAVYDDEGKKTKNARMTVRHNGVVIHKDLEIKKGTPGRIGEGPQRGGLFLQNHGNPVAFRNIWVVEK